MKLSKSMKVFLSAMFVTLPLMLISPDAYALPKTFVGTPSQVTASLDQRPVLITGRVADLRRMSNSHFTGKLFDPYVVGKFVYIFVNSTENYGRINAARNLIMRVNETNSLIRVEGGLHRTPEGYLVINVEDAGLAQ